MNKDVLICDRCKREYDRYRFPQLRFKRKLVSVRLTKIFTPDPYDYTERGFDLCHACAGEFEQWINQAGRRTP